MSAENRQIESPHDESKCFLDAADSLDKLIDLGSLTFQNPFVLSFRQAFAANLLRNGDLKGEEIWRHVVQETGIFFGDDDGHTLICKQSLAVSLASFRLTADDTGKQVANVDKEKSRSLLSGDKETSKKQIITEADLVAQRAGERGIELLREVLASYIRLQAPGEWQKVELTKLKLAELLIEKVWPPQPQEGEVILHDVLQTRAKRLHEDDRSLWDLRWALGACLWQQGKREDAAELFYACWSARKRLLGPDHPDTQAAAQYYKRAAESNRTPCMTACILQ